MTGSARERYSALRGVGVRTLLELEDGAYYSPDVDFDKTRFWPYPLLRYQIAKELYNLPGTSLTSIGMMMGIKHCTLSVGLDKISSYLNAKDAEVVHLFREIAGDLQHRIDKVWSVDDDHSILYLLIMEEAGRGLMSDDGMEWYTENDDLAQFIINQ